MKKRLFKYFSTICPFDIEKLKRGEYKLEEVMEVRDDNNKLLGQHKNKDVYLKCGKFATRLLSLVLALELVVGIFLPRKKTHGQEGGSVLPRR